MAMDRLSYPTLGAKGAPKVGHSAACYPTLATKTKTLRGLGTRGHAGLWGARQVFGNFFGWGGVPKVNHVKGPAHVE